MASREEYERFGARHGCEGLAAAGELQRPRRRDEGEGVHRLAEVGEVGELGDFGVVSELGEGAGDRNGSRNGSRSAVSCDTRFSRWAVVMAVEDLRRARRTFRAAACATRMAAQARDSGQGEPCAKARATEAVSGGLSAVAACRERSANPQGEARAFLSALLVLPPHGWIRTFRR